MKLINNLLILFLNFKIIHSFQKYNSHNLFNKLIKKKYSNHINLGYDKSKKILFNDLKKYLIYGNEINKDINCEHIWCQKYFKYKEPMKSDLHIMFLSNSRLNSHRQDYKFKNIHKNFIFLNNKGIIIDNNFLHKFLSYRLYKKNNKKKIFEPPNKSKGKISRSVAYFHSIYEINDNKLNKIIEVEDLINWNRHFLPTMYEIERNEMIRIHQNNINPFIKYPILIEIVYNDKFSTFYFCKLSFYTLFTIIISDLFKLNYILKKNIG